MAKVIRSSPHEAGPDPEWLVNQIAHALRNPIFAALVQSEALVLKAGDDESLGRSAHMVQKQLKRVETNLEEMLLLGRPAKLNIRKTDLVSLMSGVVEAASKGLLGDPAAVRFDPAAPSTEMSTDPNAVQIIIERLLANAVQHTEPPHEVLLGVDHPTPDTVCISVVDGGEGISDELCDTAFLPFSPQHAGRPGLGLSVAAKFAHALGGHIEIETTPGEGTTARCVLPVSSPSASS